MAFESNTKGAGTCEGCGKAFAVRRIANGSVKPIGTPACSCGATSFRVLER